MKNIKKKITRRVYWADNLKVIALFFVILGHTRTLGIKWHPYIYSFHLATFFFISGFLFQTDGPYRQMNLFIKKKISTIIIPYLFFGFITYLFWLLVARYVGADSNADINPVIPLLGMFYGAYSSSGLAHNIPLWFLPCLFSVQIIFYFLEKLFNIKTIILISFLGGCTVLLYGNKIPFLLPWGVDSALKFMPYFCAGFVLKPHLGLINSFKPSFIIISIAAVTGLQIFLFTHSNSLLFVKYYGLGFTGITFWLLIAVLVGKLFIIESLANETISIYALHDFAFSVIVGFFYYICHLPLSTRNDSATMSIVLTIFSFFFLYPISLLIRKYLSWAIGYR